FESRLSHDAPAALVALVPYGVSRLAPHFAEVLATRKTLREEARRWLLRHPEAAASGLLAPAMGRPGPARTRAEAALRLIGQNGHDDVLLEVAERAGAKEAMAELLAFNPLDRFPAKLPSLPTY